MSRDQQRLTDYLAHRRTWSRGWADGANRWSHANARQGCGFPGERQAGWTAEEGHRRLIHRFV